nr:E3 ubiquitin-protein ligase RNF165-like isoform X2 [Leptinotarsa decemlineata]
MSDNQGKSNNWAWILGTGVAALAGAAVAAATIMNNQPAEYSPVPRRRVRQVTGPSLPGCNVPFTNTNIELPEKDLEQDWDDASSTSSDGNEQEGQPQKCCQICLRHLTKEPVEDLACQHRFHETCIKKWINKSPECPTCRRPVTLQQ